MSVLKVFDCICVNLSKTKSERPITKWIQKRCQVGVASFVKPCVTFLSNSYVTQSQVTKKLISPSSIDTMSSKQMLRFTNIIIPPNLWSNILRRTCPSERDFSVFQKCLTFKVPCSFLFFILSFFLCLFVFFNVLRGFICFSRFHSQIPIRSWNARAFLSEFLWTPLCSVGKQITYLHIFLIWLIYFVQLFYRYSFCYHESRSFLWGFSS